MKLPIYMIYDNLEEEYLPGYSRFKDVEEKVLEKINKACKDDPEFYEGRFEVVNIEE